MRLTSESIEGMGGNATKVSGSKSSEPSEIVSRTGEACRRVSTLQKREVREHLRLLASSLKHSVWDLRIVVTKGTWEKPGVQKTKLLIWKEKTVDKTADRPNLEIFQNVF